MKTERFKKLTATVMLLFICAVFLGLPAISMAQNYYYSGDDSPGKPIYNITRSWWEEGKLGVLIASVGLMSGAVALGVTKRFMAFVIPAVAGILMGASFSLADKLFQIGQGIF